MKPFTLNQASQVCHRSKSTLLDAIKNGRLSATRNDKKQWQIDPAELCRVYPYAVFTEPSTEHFEEKNEQKTAFTEPPTEHFLLPEPLETAKPNTEFLSELLDKEKQERERERQLLQDTIADLRYRLDESEAERKATQEKLTLFLEHKPIGDRVDSKSKSENLLWKKIFRK
jgi:hypothetical protein